MAQTLFLGRTASRKLAGLAVVTTIGCTGASSETHASEVGCAPIVTEARRLILVTTDGMRTQSARLQLFARESPQAAWHAVAGRDAAVVGRAGLAWGFPFRTEARPGEPVKVEGDGRTPAGFYRIGRSFGFAASARIGHLTLKPGQVTCVDDPGSMAYNTLVTAGSMTNRPRGEDMGAEPLYRRGLIVDYPSDAATRAGSCIFLHVWRGPGRGTAGCIALPEARVAMIQDFAAVDGVIAILPIQALERFMACLPSAVQQD